MLTGPHVSPISSYTLEPLLGGNRFIYYTSKPHISAPFSIYIWKFQFVKLWFLLETINVVLFLLSCHRKGWVWLHAAISGMLQETDARKHYQFYDWPIWTLRAHPCLFPQGTISSNRSFTMCKLWRQSFFAIFCSAAKREQEKEAFSSFFTFPQAFARLTLFKSDKLVVFPNGVSPESNIKIVTKKGNDRKLKKPLIVRDKCRYHEKCIQSNMENLHTDVMV